MANKGLQFEHAVMYHATVLIDNKNADQQSAFEKASAAYSNIPSNIPEKGKITNVGKIQIKVAENNLFCEII